MPGHCIPCNQKVGRFDERYGEFVSQLVHLSGLLTQSERRLGPLQPGQPFAVAVDDVRPGSIVRSLLGAMLALNPQLRIGYPQIAIPALVDAEPVEWPEDLQLRIGFLPAGHVFIQGPITPITLDTQTGRVTETLNIEGVISFPPVYAVLSGPMTQADWDPFEGLMSIGPWLSEDYRLAREVALHARVVTESESFEHPFDPTASMLRVDLAS